MSTKYTEEHEWVREQDGLYAVGITDYAQEQLGEIVYVELPDAGKEITRGEDAAVVESVKAASEIKSPLSGRVVAHNEKLADSPELINAEPESGGWFYTMRASDAAEWEGLLDADAYQKFVQSLA
ncbi:MAG: glycine cleavage system protein GcvH [Gammaproteobacteria bacterium]